MAGFDIGLADHKKAWVYDIVNHTIPLPIEGEGRRVGWTGGINRWRDK